MTSEEFEKIREIVKEAMTIPPPPNCWLKEIEPNVFAWVKCANEEDDDDAD